MVKFLEIARGKSGAREVATSLLLLWGFITIRHFCWVSVEVHAAQNDAWESLSLGVLPWAAAAFGVHVASRLGILGGRNDGAEKPTPTPPAGRQGRAKREPEATDPDDIVG